MDPGCRFQLSEHIATDGKQFFEAVDAMGLEGIVSKKTSSPYRSGRPKSWLKIECFAEDLLTVIGFERSRGTAPAALLAREGPDGLSYAGSAMVTLAGPQRERFWRAMERGAVLSPAVPMAKTAGGAAYSESVGWAVRCLTNNGNSNGSITGTGIALKVTIPKIVSIVTGSP